MYLCTESLIVNFDTNLVYHLKNLRFAEREGTISPIMKGKEGLVPTQVEIGEHRRKLEEHWGKVKVAGATGIILAGASLAFPPAIAGAVVVSGEMARQVIKMNLEVIRFHSKYPDLD